VVCTSAQDDKGDEDEREEARLAPVPPATDRKPVRCLHKDRNMVVLVFDREWQHVQGSVSPHRPSITAVLLSLFLDFFSSAPQKIQTKMRRRCISD